MSCKCKNLRKHNACKKYIWNPSRSTFDNGKYLASITGGSVVIYDKIIQVARTVPTKTIFNKNYSNQFL